MATATIPPAPSAKTNRVGLEMAQYKGNKSTLCAGCGHNAISERIIEACFEMGVKENQPQHQVLVLCRVHLSTQLVSRLPECFLHFLTGHGSAFPFNTALTQGLY